jgi:predicted nucleic acid-binding protein
VTRSVPSETIVIDANILVSAVLGVATARVISKVAEKRFLILGLPSLIEAQRTVRHIANEPRTAIGRLEAYAASMELVNDVRFAETLDLAGERLRNAPASRNGSARDAHVLALAWLYDADIWSHDRDFAGAGWPSWSSANLQAALADATTGA